MHKVCVDALRGNCIPCIASHMYCTNHLYSRPSPRGQGGRQRGKCVAFFKNNIPSNRAAEQGKCLIFTFMHQSFVTTPKPRGKAGTLTFSPAKPCQKPTLRGQSVGKSAAVSSAVSCFHYTACLPHLNQRLIGELIVYPWPGVRRRPSVICRSQCSNTFSKTTWPIKAKFYMEPPWVGGTKFGSRHVGHMTKMAATPIYEPHREKTGFLHMRKQRLGRRSASR